MAKVTRVRNTSASEVTTDSGAVVLVSYSTPVAAKVNGTTYRTDKKYSPTTSGHINQFCGHGIGEVRPPEFFSELISGEGK